MKMYPSISYPMKKVTVCVKAGILGKRWALGWAALKTNLIIAPPLIKELFLKSPCEAVCLCRAELEV